MSNKEYFAVIQNGYGILGVGKTEESAIENAKQEPEDEDIAERLTPSYEAVNGSLVLGRITPALYDTVMRSGGDCAFSELEDGSYGTVAEAEAED